MNTYYVIYQNYKMSSKQEIKGNGLATDSSGNIIVKNGSEIVGVFPLGTTVYKKEQV
jgi:hypothetical protein